jgi:hypothetical protein
MIAVAHLLQSEGLLAASDSPAGLQTSRRGHSHFPACATAVIVLFQNGGPSQVDLFDPKPDLQKRSGQKHPGDVESFQPGSQSNTLMGSPFRFERRGECGMDFSQLLPQLGSMADDLCMVRSMYSDNNNHPQALRCLNTGKVFSGRPTLGAWITYALGTENENLPAYVVLRDPEGYNTGGPTLWDNGWLPAEFRGTEIRSRGAPVLNLHPGLPLPEGVQRNDLELLAGLNEQYHRLFPDDNELEARIRNYELAARMQRSAEQVLSLARESAATRKLYGLDNPVTENLGTRCLMARRMVEAGVRFILIPAPIKHGANPWDHHSNLKPGLEALCPQVDQPAAALIKDLKERGLLETTIVVWSGEFGRLPINQGGSGRDHNRHAFTLLLAGGGFKAGMIHGKTDEFGYRAIEDRVSCPDLLATLLQQMGLDHSRRAFRHNGREESLTDPAVTGAHVVAELLRRSPQQS